MPLLLLAAVLARVRVHVACPEALFDVRLLSSLFSRPWVPAFRSSRRLSLSLSPQSDARDQSVLCVLRSDLSALHFFCDPSKSKRKVWLSPELAPIASVHAILRQSGLVFTSASDDAEFLVSVSPNLTLGRSPELSRLFSNVAVPVYVLGCRSFASLLRCSPGFSPSPTFVQLSLVLLLSWLVILSAFVALSRGSLFQRTTPARLDLCWWEGRSCATCHRFVTVHRPVLPGLSLCLTKRIRYEDTEPELPPVEPHSVKVTDSLTLRLSIRPIKPVLSSSLDVISELTRVFFQGIIAEARLPVSSMQEMNAFVDYFVSIWDIALFSLYTRTGSSYQLVVSNDRTDGRVPITREMLDAATATELLRPPGLVDVGEYDVLVIRTVYAERHLWTVLAVQSGCRCIPAMIDFFHRFTAVAISLAHGLFEEHAIKESFKNCISMMRHTHLFSFVETARSTGEVISRICGMPSEVSEIVANFTPGQTDTFRREISRLTTTGQTFSRVPYEVVLPNDDVHCFAVSANASIDGYYGDTVLSLLYEDISVLHRRSVELKMALADMSLASRLLDLHHFTMMPDMTIHTESTFCVHPDDHHLLSGSETATVRLSVDGVEWEWYTIVWTSIDRGILVSVHEVMDLKQAIEMTRSCFKSVNASQAFAVWAIDIKGSQSTPRSVFRSKPLDSFLNRIDPSSASEFNVDVLSRLQTHRTFVARVRMPHSTTYEWCSVTIVPVSKAEILCFVFNIAERKRASDLIRQTRQLLDLALHFSDVHVWYFKDTCDGHRLILTIDPESSPFVEMDWGTLEHNVIAEYQQSVVKAFRTSLDSGSPLELEVPFFFDTIRWLLLRGMVWEDGGRRQLVGVYFDLTDIKEAANEMARQKAVAEEASLAKSTFLANMSHEIRTPLNGICGLLEIIKTSELPPEQTDLISCIQKSFSDLLELLNDTLDLAKLESGKLIPLSVSFNPHDVLLSIHESVFTYKRNEPNVYFHIVTSPKEPLLYRGDPHCMMRIVTNLLSNACKNTKHGFITVYISSKDERLFVFAVKDTGCGMTPEVLESIRGHIRHGKTMAVYENTRVGVGLSLVTEMVRLHSGTVRIESEVDVGTTVTVEMPWEPIYYPWFKHRLPTPVRTVMYGRESEVSAMILEYAEFYGQKCRCLKQLDEALTAPSDLLLIGVSADGKEYHWLKEQLERGCFRGTVIACLTAVRPPSLGRPVELFTRPLNPELLRRYFIKIAFGKVNDKSHFHRPVDMMPTNLGLHVLAADDNATNQLVMRQVLKKLGCTFEVVSSGLEALAAIEKTKFDLVLMDQHMPEMDGLEATRRIRRMPGDMAAVPIIAMTASILREDEEACWKAGMTAFLCKPVTLKQLAKMIECVMTGKKGLRPENFL